MGLIAKNTVTYIVIMRHLYFIEQNDVFKFCGVTNYCSFANDGVTTDECTVSYLCFLVNNTWSVNISGWENGSRFCNPYILSTLLVFVFWQTVAQFDDKGTDLRKKLPGIGSTFK